MKPEYSATKKEYVASYISVYFMLNENNISEQPLRMLI